MNKIALTCAILCSDPQMADRLAEYIGKMPDLLLAASHRNPLDALNEYLKNKVNLYFVELGTASETEGIDGMEFSRLLSAETRVVFIAKDECHAARCFQLDALDYLTELNLSTFFQAMNKAMRWFARRSDTSGRPSFISRPDTRGQCFIHIRSENRIIRLRLGSILYVEGMGDYAKLHTTDDHKPLLTLSSMKLMETRLPGDMFIRIHHSFIVNMERVGSIERSEVTLTGGKRLPVGDAYRKRLERWVAERTVI